MEKKIVIIGAGPTGLGTAYALQEYKHTNWKIYEKNAYVGGLAHSFKDENGFVWDIGGHVIFSHYEYFDNLFEKLMKKEYLEHKREAHIWMVKRFVPYPFQNNIKYLPKEKILDCLIGLIKAQKQERISNNFKEWLLSTFGEGIFKYFLYPYNLKVWAYPLEMMSKRWIGERVSVINIYKILENVILDKDDISWGPNAKFKFPLIGGTGNLFNRFIPYIKNNLYLNKEIISINTEHKIVYFKDNTKEKYDILINTAPLNELILKSDIEKLKKEVKKLKYASGVIVGIGLKGKLSKKLNSRCWMYFPENDNPFYRVTVFSNYSHTNAPKGCWSLMAEVSYSDYKKIDKENIIAEVIQGIKNTELISSEDEIISKWAMDVKYSYPIPTLERDKILKKIQYNLMGKDIYSRGRFGAWKYEIGNMDHSVMQGKEIIDKILLNKKEEIWNL